MKTISIFIFIKRSTSVTQVVLYTPTFTDKKMDMENALDHFTSYANKFDFFP
jgi:hypothetical protein